MLIHTHTHTHTNTPTVTLTHIDSYTLKHIFTHIPTLMHTLFVNLAPPVGGYSVLFVTL